MESKLKKGDTITLLPTSDLLKVFDQRNFFSEKDRQEFAIILGGKSGVITKIEDKYAFVYFKPNGNSDQWTVPYEAVELNNPPR